MSLQLDKGGGYQTYRVIEIKDSLSKFALKLRDKYGTHLDKFGKKLWDRSRGHLAVSLINRPCVYVHILSKQDERERERFKVTR